MFNTVHLVRCSVTSQGAVVGGEIFDPPARPRESGENDRVEV